SNVRLLNERRYQIYTLKRKRLGYVKLQVLIKVS
ncbi:MAG: hypothetical protein ACI8UP_005139, partial [Porticoccaceae bacterium]